MKNTIIYLIGFPGTGKYTVAKEVCVLSPDFKLVDNHLINIPIFSLIDLDGVTQLPARVWKNIGIIWEAVRDTIIHISPPDYSFILTNVLGENNPNDRIWFTEVQKAAKARQATFVPVRLLCAVEEREKRIVGPDRKARMKETDPAAPRRHSETDDVLRVDHPNLLTLDITDIPPEQAAGIILDHARRIAASAA